MWKRCFIIFICIIGVWVGNCLGNKETEAYFSKLHPTDVLQQIEDTLYRNKNNTKRATSVKPTHVAKLWPVKTPPLQSGSILPSHRIVAFYGNPYSKRMGILGEFPPDTVLLRLRNKIQEWQNEDSSRKVIPALELITVSGQSTPGRDSLYRLRMPFSLVDSIIKMADTIHALVILDFQVGKSTVEAEVPFYKRYLKMPQVELAIDPEFSMKRGYVPGTRIGTLNADDINFCIDYLKGLVIKYHLPPKILVIHRFTQNMVTGYRNIHLCSQVQVIMDMDGFGAQALKKDAYHDFIYKEPVEYTGIKLFFKNDNRNGHKMMTPGEALGLYPQPLYIQYQ